MKAKLLLVAAGLLAASMAAQATVVTVGGNGYEITTVSGSFEDHQALLESQLWWEDTDLARAFAEALPSDVGLPNPGPTGPIFAYTKFLTGLNYTFASWSRFSDGVVRTASGPVGQDGLTFAIAQRVTNSVPEPGTLALLGLGLAGLGLCQRRRAG